MPTAYSLVRLEGRFKFNQISSSAILIPGIQATPVEASPMGEEYKPPRNVDKMGSIYLDNEPFVGFEYRERNYRTMMAEDWAGGGRNSKGR
jgi:hypothetical protein